MAGPPLASKEKRSGGDACLVLLHPPGPDIGRRIPLLDVGYLVGRELPAGLVIGRESISRRHAQLQLDPQDDWWVEDLRSTNGTFVNEVRMTTLTKLVDGDQVRFGDVIYKFLAGSNIESAYHEEIYKLTILDGLTQIHNKRYFLEFLERELAVAHRHGHPLCLVMFDVDHFKKVNDTRGHLAGDAVLKDLAARVKLRIRREDLFARYGGEEFACVLPSTNLAGGIVFAEQVRSIIEEKPCSFDGVDIHFTVSLGVSAVHKEPGVDGMSLIRKADENLYVAKRGGRNKVVPSLADLISD